MERVDREPNRHFLGRIPLVEEAPGLFMPSRSDGGRRAAWARFGKRNSALTRWLADDPHLGPFLTIPAKENGFDVEGLAVRGERIWLGLRGPVLRGHAVVLDLEITEKPPGRLKARRIEGERRYRKHLLDTRGLGIRDMRFDGDDLLLLVGPTMSLEGPAFVLRWRDAVHDDVSGVIDPARIDTVAELPYRLHADHPEGIDLWPEAGPGGLLVIYDAPAPERTDPEDLHGARRPDRPAPAKSRVTGQAGGGIGFLIFGPKCRPQAAKAFFATVVLATLVGMTINVTGINPIKALVLDGRAQRGDCRAADGGHDADCLAARHQGTVPRARLAPGVAGPPPPSWASPWSGCWRRPSEAGRGRNIGEPPFFGLTGNGFRRIWLFIRALLRRAADPQEP